MKPKEFRETCLRKVETGLLFAYQKMVIGGKLYFSDTPMIHFNMMPISAEELQLMFMEDEVREKSDLN